MGVTGLLPIESDPRSLEETRSIEARRREQAALEVASVVDMANALRETVEGLMAQQVVLETAAHLAVNKTPEIEVPIDTIILECDYTRLFGNPSVIDSRIAVSLFPTFDETLPVPVISFLGIDSRQIRHTRFSGSDDIKAFELDLRDLL